MERQGRSLMRCAVDEFRSHLTAQCAGHCLGALLAVAIIVLGTAWIIDRLIAP